MPFNKLIDLSGQKFGRWTVLSRDISVEKSHAFWICLCDCGSRKSVSGSCLRRGISKSCGCLRNEDFGKKSTTHGKSYSLEYKTWQSMIARCYYPSKESFKNYGAKGIKVCDEWKNSFEQFYKDMGKRPFQSASLDRIDNSKGYSKENCRWASMQEQERNKTNNIVVEFNGFKGCLTEVCEHFGLNLSAIRSRIYKGWTVSDALSKPIRFKSEKGNAIRNRDRANQKRTPWL